MACQPAGQGVVMRPKADGAPGTGLGVTCGYVRTQPTTHPAGLCRAAPCVLVKAGSWVSQM